MRRYILLWLMMMGVSSIIEAQNHFIYLQSETNQPFTVSVKEKKFNSTASGYVIIPKLKAGNHDLLVRFGNETVDRRFSTVIDKKDIGLTLRGLNGSNASLVDMQTFSIIAPAASIDLAKNESVPSTNNSVQPSTSTDEAKEDKGTIKPAIVKLKKGVNKISEVKESSGISLRFIDVQSKGSDTIDIAIPIKKSTGQSSLISGVNPLFIWASNNYVDAVQDGYNTKCVHLVTRDDYARLRKKMAAETDADKMVAEAVRVSKNKCLETQQVKNLAALFNKESGKLKFFEAVYPYVYDYLEYPTLEPLFDNDDYRHKFRALLNK